jgi:hypothetical protein
LNCSLRSPSCKEVLPSGAKSVHGTGSVPRLASHNCEPELTDVARCSLPAAGSHEQPRRPQAGVT